MSNHISDKENKELELELRSKWLEWQNKSHLEDQMSFIDYVDELEVYKGYNIQVVENNYKNSILFFK
tara:strand:+ start:251 stop:451 length:201 start_codon:yes stop_codon:yes gene_type:complete